jgi:hypothetical protein
MVKRVDEFPLDDVLTDNCQGFLGRVASRI